MANKQVKRIAISIAIFCAGTITGHLVSNLLIDSNKTASNKAKDITPAIRVSASNKSFSSNPEDGLQYKPELHDQKIADLKRKLDQMIKKASLQEKFISILNDNLDKIIEGNGNLPIDEIIRQKLEAMNLDDQEMLGLIQSWRTLNHTNLLSDILKKS